MNIARLKKLQSSLEHPVLIKKKENLFYLTGYSFDYRAEEYLLVTKKNVAGFGSGLEHINWIKKSDQLKNIGKYLKGSKRLDVEFKFTYGEGAYLKYKLPGKTVKPVYSPADKQRVVKEPGEIALIKKSMQTVEKVFGLIRKEIKKPGMTEIRLAEFIKRAGHRFGAQDISFPPIVASGKNAAIPHHVPSNKKLKAGESIILDFGFKYKNYCSDFTRTVFLKSAPKKLAEAYEQVEKAYWEAMGSISGQDTKAGNIYQKVVDVLAEKKLEKYFIHSLGHGTGLEIHELPNLSPHSRDILQNNMVFSIEPGVYIPKVGGIRIEDLVYLEKGKAKRFIAVSTKLTDNIIK